MGAKLFIGIPWMRNEVVLKNDMGYVKIHGLHGNPLYDNYRNGVGLQIQSYLGFYLLSSTKFGVKLKLRHMLFFLLSDMWNI